LKKGNNIIALTVNNVYVTRVVKGGKMVLLFSKRKSKTEEEITEILTEYGADYISDRKVYSKNKKFTVISEYKKSDIKIDAGIAIILDEGNRFKEQLLNKGIIGICENSNKSALGIFERNKIPIISCGNNSKNTITFSSLNDNGILISLQRTLINLKGEEILPCELNIKLNHKYQPFSVMASTAVLLLNGIEPQEF